MRDDVGNSIKVLYTRYSPKVIVEATDTSVLLYNHSDLPEKEKICVFTGINFKGLDPAIVIEFKDLEGKEIEDYYLLDNSICLLMDKNELYSEPVAEAIFKAEGSDLIYKPHLIECKV